jgi:Na+-transporting methylmalonyl-CoA/oxaloacetate decarboxylase gamma subunit
MENLKFGFTMTVLGMGGTLAILLLISLVVSWLNKFMIRGDKRREARGRS